VTLFGRRRVRGMRVNRQSEIPKMDLHFVTRQELIPFTAPASLSIDDNRSMWIPKGSEILRLYAYLRPAPERFPRCDSTYSVCGYTVAIS